MYIITKDNEFFKYHSDALGYSISYLNGEVSILVHSHVIPMAAYASIPGDPKGIELGFTGKEFYPTSASRQLPLWIQINTDSPTLGKIPPDHRKTLIKAATLLSSSPVTGHEKLTEILIQTKLKLLSQQSTHAHHH